MMGRMGAVILLVATVLFADEVLGKSTPPPNGGPAGGQDSKGPQSSGDKPSMNDTTQESKVPGHYDDITQDYSKSGSGYNSTKSGYQSYSPGNHSGTLPHSPENTTNPYEGSGYSSGSPRRPGSGMSTDHPRQPGEGSGVNSENPNRLDGGGGERPTERPDDGSLSNPKNRENTDGRTGNTGDGAKDTRLPNRDRTTTVKSPTNVREPGSELPGRIEKEFLTEDQRRKLEGAFGSESTSSFTGSELFDPASGNLTGDFWESLDSDEQRAMDNLQKMGKEAFNLEAIFNDSLPDDVVFFTREFDNMDQTTFQKFIDTPDMLAPEDLKEISLSVMSAMNETTLRSKLQSVPSSTKTSICSRLQNAEADYDSTKRLVKGIDCSTILASNNEVPCGSLAEAVAENKMEEQSPESWDNAKRSDAINKGWMSGLPKEVIETFPSSLLRQNMDKVRKMKDCLDKEVQEKIFSKIKADMGGFSRMAKTDIENMGDMVGQMSYREMKNLDSATVKESMSTFRDSASSMNRLQKMQIKKSMKSTGSAANWTAEDIVNSAVFYATDRNVIKELDVDKVVEKLTELESQDFDRRSSRTLAKKIRESADYDEPSDFDNAKFKKMGKFAAAFSSRDIQNMTSVNFLDVLNDGALSQIDFPKDSARALIDRINTDLGGTLQQTHLEKLDKAVVGLRKDEVDNINGDDLANALETMKTTMSEVMTEMDDTTLATMVEKVETASGGLCANLEKMGPLLQKVPVKKLQNISNCDIGDMSGKTERDFNCSKDTCPELYKRVTSSIGTPSLKNPNFTLSAFKNLKKVMCGMPLDDLRSLPATTVLEDVAGYLLELKCLSDKQERILAEKLKYRLGLFGDSVKSIRRQDVRKFGGIMKHFTVDELKQLGRCTDITLELGAQDLSNVKKNDIKDLASYALDCYNKTEGKLTNDDVTAAGDLLCGLNTNRIKDIESDAMPDAIFNIQSKCAQLGTNERQEWAKVSLEKLNITKSEIASVEDVELTQLGTFTGELGKATIDEISNEVMSSVSPDLVDQFTELYDNKESRDEKGFGGDVSSKDKTTSDNNKKQVYTKVIEATIQTTSNSRRRKRSTSTLTCDDMQLLGSGVTAMTTSQIEAMSDTDFIDCAQTLGGYSTWDSNQLLSLLTVATRTGTYGDSTVWTSDHVYNVGIIAQGLTSTELQALTQLTIDSMYSIGRHSGWSETQLSAGFERWLALNKGDDASTITSTEIISLGHFACGASTTHIEQIDSTIYSYAASYIGALTSCQESQLVAWANHAKTAFGATSTWDTSVITTIGTVIGGLTSSEIGTLTTSQVAAIEPSSIAEIPPSTFVGFTVDQLSSFSTAQALSTTASQQSGLSSAQLSALESAGATIYGTANAVHVSFVLMILAVTAAIFLQ